MSELEQAKTLLETTESTIVFVHGDCVLTKNERGIKSLLSILESEGTLEGYSCADTIVGKAAALCMVLLKVKAVYGQTMSEEGYRVLTSHGIEATYGEKVPMIINRTNTGMCPMEQAVKDIEDPKEAQSTLIQTVQAMQNKQGK